MQETKPRPTITEKDGIIEIEIPVIDFKDTEIIDGLPEKIILHPTYVENKWKYSSRQKNEDTNLQEEKSYIGSRIILKKHIIGVDACFSQSHQQYQTNIYTANGEPISPLFPSFKQSQEVKNTILNWLLK